MYSAMVECVQHCPTSQTNQTIHIAAVNTQQYFEIYNLLSSFPEAKAIDSEFIGSAICI